MNYLIETLKNQLIQIPFVKDRAMQFHSTGVNQQDSGISTVLDYYKQFCNYENKDILEMGPGQTFGIAQEAMKQAKSYSIIDIDQYIDPKIVEDLGIDYKIYNGKYIPYEDNSFDLIWSYTVYEHIRYPSISVQETYRILKPGGRVIHFIDLGDHFSYGENGNPDELFNCLKYPEKLWNAMTWNRSSYVNRLRFSDWVNLHKHKGFSILDIDGSESDHIRKLYENGQLEYLSNFSERDRFTENMTIVAGK